MKHFIVIFTVLHLFSSCALFETKETSTSEAAETEKSVNNPILTTSATTLDFAEILTNSATFELLKSENNTYPYEIRNYLEWLSFSSLKGIVSSDNKTITAYVDFGQFDPQEIKKGHIEIYSGEQSISISVYAQNYFYSDVNTELITNQNIFTTYNQSGKELSFNISNSSQLGCIIYSLTTEEEWIDFESSLGYLFNDETKDIPISIDWSLIEDKALSKGYITVTNHTNPKQTKTILIKAKSEPKLYVSKTTMTQKSNSNNSNTFEVGNSLALSLPYTITADKSWVSFSKERGNVSQGDNDLIEVFIDYSDFIEDTAKTSVITINSDYGTKIITLTATGYPSFKTSSVNMLLKSIETPVETLSITNTGCGIMEYNLTHNTEILTLSKTQGSLNHGETEEIYVSAIFENLDWDIYTYSEIKLTTHSDSKLFKVNAMREVDPLQDPRLYVNRSSINISSTDSSSESFTISNIGSGTMKCDIVSSESWLNLSSNSATVTGGLQQKISFSIINDVVTSGDSCYIKITTNGVYSNSHIINISIK